MGCYFLSKYGIDVNNFSFYLNFSSLELGLREISKFTVPCDYYEPFLCLVKCSTLTFKYKILSTISIIKI